MTFVVMLLGILLVAIGAVGVVRPRRVVGVIQGLEPRTRLAVAVGIRVVVGIVLLLAAPGCRHPTVVAVLGWIALLAALLLPVLGTARLDAIVAWWLERSPPFLRLQFLGVGAFGVFLVYTGLP